MSVRRIKNHGEWVWQARVAFQGFRRAAFRSSREEARQAEADLLRDLKAQVGQAETEAARPATLRQLLEGHEGDVVFPRPDGRPYSREQIGTVFRRASRGSGLKDFHFRDLRHHGATMALNKGNDIRDSGSAFV